MKRKRKREKEKNGWEEAVLCEGPDKKKLSDFCGPA